MNNGRKLRGVDDSVVIMTEIVLPEDSNPRGSIFGGRVLALIDKCAAVAAMRHARSDVATVSLDSVTFVNKVKVGDVLQLRGRLNATFTSSMEVEVEVHAEDPLTGESRLTTTAFVTMVALDSEGSPTPVPGLATSSAAEEERARAAATRRKRRLDERRES